MGNNNGKRRSTSAYDANLEKLFADLAQGNPRISYNALKVKWGAQLNSQLWSMIEGYFRSHDGSGVTKDAFKAFYYEQCKGSSETRAKSVVKLIGLKETATRYQMLEFVKSVLESVLIIQDLKCRKTFSSWSSKLSRRKTDSIQNLGAYFVGDFDRSKGADCTWEDVERIMSNFNSFWFMTLSSLYQTEEDEFFCHLLPLCKQVPADVAKKNGEFSILDIPRIIFINVELPVDCQGEWRLLFASPIDGESFSSLAGRIVQKGPTVLVIQDKAGNVFGGFAPVSWSLGPNFKGDSRSFLFTLAPRMKIFSPSGFNSNFQYINVGQQTMPNGLGMGGRLEYFGMWLSSNYGNGSCSESCTTYRNYSMMSATKDFHVSHLEVWGVGPPPPTPAELGERSVLDGNAEARAILEMAGKTAYSDGLREKND